MTVSSRVRQAMGSQSWIRQMFELGTRLKQQHGEDRVFDLSLGNPALDPPEVFSRELRRLAESPDVGMHRYMPNAGYPETRAAVAAHLAAATGLPFTSDHVVMTCGAGGALNVTLKAVMDPGDEVVVLAPYFPEYLGYADNHGGVPRVVATDTAFQPDPAALESALTERTRAVIVNSPNNPTGVVYPDGALEAIGGVLGRAEARFGTTIALISDEPYARLTYDGIETPPVFPYHSTSLLVTSFSKDLSLAGERIGYVAVNPACPDAEEMVGGLIYCNRTLGFVNAPALMQRIVPAILGSSVDVDWYRRKRDYLWDRLTAMGYRMVRPRGAFYAFPASPINDDVAFVRSLLEWNVLVTPGTGFGRPGHFRVYYSVEDRVLEGAMEGFSRAARACGLPG
jgi:aspartate aminotransferase